MYLEGRQYDVNELISQWGVLYSSDPNYFQAPYLVFPIFVHGKLLTWQARYIGDDHELRGCPKYYFDPTGRKSEILYNIDRVRHQRLGVLVEGIPSAVRIGPAHGLCCFGKDPSPRQVRILRSMFANGTLVVMFDNDAREQTNKMINNWRAAGYFGRLINIELPDDNDPGDYTTVANWEMINRYLEVK